MVISGEDASTQIRFSRASIIVEYIMQQSPLIGSGLGNESFLATKIGIISVNSDTVYINNYYQYLITTTGLIGTIVFLSGILYIILDDLKRSKLLNNSYKRYLKMLIIIYIIFNIFTNGFFITPIFWIPLGILLSIMKNDVKLNKQGVRT